MIASLFGPSGSDRRMFSLVALTVLLMPAGTLAAKFTFTDLSLRETLTIGCLGTAVLLSVCVILYGCTMMVVNGLRDGAAEQDNTWENDTDTVAL